jgi:hypothetical protein
VHFTNQLFYKAAKVMTLQDFVANNISKDHKLDCISWSKIYLTENFAYSIDLKKNSNISIKKNDTNYLDRYLRPVDVMIQFPLNFILLVSEYEADAILSMFWKKDPKSLNGLQFINLSNLKRFEETLLWKNIFQFKNISVASLVLLQLFNGDTSFTSNEQKNCLKTLLLENKGSKDAMLALPSIRGLQFMVYRSDLELLCKLFGI